MISPGHETLVELERLHGACGRLFDEVGKTIVGQREVLEQVLIALIARGHCLLVGAPGLAKTLMIRALARSLDLSFNRIQFTPDLMPTDITGGEILYENRQTGERGFRFLEGPVFASIVLADEINRAPPKTQAALLEAMQERQVTIGGKRHVLPDPFFVLATQNPWDQEGTYSLPEAQLDRFMFHVEVNYPSEEEELEIVERTTANDEPPQAAPLPGALLNELQSFARRLPIPEAFTRYAIRLARKTRPNDPTAPEYIRKYLEWGAGPRASQHLVLGAKARATMQGRAFVTGEDIEAIAAPVLRRRIKLNFRAEAESITVEETIRRLLADTPFVERDSDRERLEQLARPQR